MLTQHDSLDPAATVRHEVIRDMADHEWAGNAKIRDVLTGLFGGLDLPGFPQGLDTVIGPLSGGERRRIALAKLLIAEQDLIVLDEPTNHLDVEGIAWLAKHLRERRSALVCVTHDRWFLDQVCTRMWDVQRGACYEYEGGYTDYVFARAERERIAATEEVQAAEPGPQGAGLAAARRPRPYVQAALPHRGRQRADRRRAAAARHQRADEVRLLPARQDRLRPGGRHRPGRARRCCSST